MKDLSLEQSNWASFLDPVFTGTVTKRPQQARVAAFKPPP